MRAMSAVWIVLLQCVLISSSSLAGYECNQSCQAQERLCNQKCNLIVKEGKQQASKEWNKQAQQNANAALQALAGGQHGQQAAPPAEDHGLEAMQQAQRAARSCNLDCQSDFVRCANDCNASR